MANWLDVFFGNLAWYRRLTGDKWTQVRVLSLQGGIIAWVRGQTYEPFEYVLKREDYRGISLDPVYAERDKLVALIAKMAIALDCRAGLAKHDSEDNDWDDDWRNIVYIDLPTGQASWHIHDSELHWFDGLPQYPDKWDGHTTEEKYQRVLDAKFEAK